MFLRANDTDKFGVETALQALHRKGIRFWIENGTLRYRARKGVITADDMVKLRHLGPLCAQEADDGGLFCFEPRVLPRLKSTRAPLAFSQLLHWSLRGLCKHVPIRQVASATRLQGRVHEGRLSEALSLIVSRHESLRARIVIVDGEPVQDTSVRRGTELCVIDLTALAPHKQAIEVRQQIASAVVGVTDYAEDSLFQIVLLRLGKEDHVLVMALDHMVSDGASLSILMQELLTAYMQNVKAGKVSLPPVGMQFPDYALWQRQVISGSLSAQAAIWNGWHRTKFPEDREAVREEGWATVKYIIPARVKVELERIARSRGTSLVMMVLTGYFAFISRWCGTSAVSIQVMSDGRRSCLVENTVGYIAFPLYLEVEMDDCDTIMGLLNAVTREYCLASDRPDFYYSYTQSPQPEFTRNTCFNWLPMRSERDRSGSVREVVVSEVEFENPCLETLEWDIDPCVLLRDRGEDVLVEVQYSRKRFSRTTMQRFVTTFIGVVESVVETPSMRLRDMVLT